MFVDADGNPCRAADAVRVVVYREPEWDEQSSREAMALHELEQQTCKGCGQRGAWRTLEGEQLPLGGRPIREFLFGWPDGKTVALKRVQCIGCASREMLDERFHEAHKDDPSDKRQHTAGVRHVVVAVRDATARPPT